MDAYIPEDWEVVTKEHFEELMSPMNIWRDGWANGIRYHQSDNSFTPKIGIGFVTNGGLHYINPSFFKRT